MLESPDEVWRGEVADTCAPLTGSGRTHAFTGRVWSVISEDVAFPEGSARRDVLLHLGAVAVIALNHNNEVLLIRQYRHPVGAWLFEPPAGLLDKPGEPPLITAQRELAEEAGYQAHTWHTLVDLYNSPGGSSEAIRIYLARDLEPLPGGRPRTGEAEEHHLPRAWVPLDEAVSLVLTSRIGSPSAVAGILGASALKANGWHSLRSADARWEARECVLAHDRVHALSPPSGG